MTKLTLTTLLLFLAAHSAVMGKQPNRVVKERNSTSRQIKANLPNDADSRTRNRTLRGSKFVTFQNGARLPIAQDQGKKEHRDPNGSGNLLLVTGGKYGDVKIARNFTAREYSRSGNQISPIARIDQRHVQCLQHLRDFVARPVIISSGYRSFAYNEALYRARGERPTRSQHISGRATDTKIPGMSGLEVAKAAIDACGTDLAIGIGRGYAHIDGRGQFKTWIYDGATNRQEAELRNYRNSIVMAQRRRAGRVVAGSVSNRQSTPRSKGAIRRTT